MRSLGQRGHCVALFEKNLFTSLLVPPRRSGYQLTQVVSLPADNSPWDFTVWTVFFFSFFFFSRLGYL